jgi:hypothetical protein
MFNIQIPKSLPPDHACWQQQVKPPDSQPRIKKLSANLNPEHHASQKKAVRQKGAERTNQMRPKQKAEMPANTIVKIVLIDVELENASVGQ